MKKVKLLIGIIILFTTAGCSSNESVQETSISSETTATDANFGKVVSDTVSKMADEVNKINDHLRLQSAPNYNEEVVAQHVQLNGRGSSVLDFGGDSDTDDKYNEALTEVVKSQKASATFLQRRLKVGYARAARLIEELEERGVIGPADGAKPRQVLVSSLEDIDS